MDLLLARSALVPPYPFLRRSRQREFDASFHHTIQFPEFFLIQRSSEQDVTPGDGDSAERMPFSPPLLDHLSGILQAQRDVAAPIRVGWQVPMADLSANPPILPWSTESVIREKSGPTVFFQHRRAHHYPGLIALNYLLKGFGLASADGGGIPLGLSMRHRPGQSLCPASWTLWEGRFQITALSSPAVDPPYLWVCIWSDRSQRRLRAGSNANEQMGDVAEWVSWHAALTSSEPCAIALAEADDYGQRASREAWKQQSSGLKYSW